MPPTLVAADTFLKASCRRKDLAEAVQTVGHAVSGRSTLPILGHVLIVAEEDRLSLSASDLELSISLTVPATVEAPGAITSPSKLLAELLGSLPESDVSLTADRSYATRVHCDRSDYKIVGLPPDEYPKLPEVQDTNRFTIPQSRLRDMIRQVIFAVSTDEARPLMTGILMSLEDGKLQLAATDTHRLALRAALVTDSQGSQQAIVPARAMNELMRLLTDEEGDVLVRLSENQAMFLTPAGARIVTRLIEGQFPSYQRVIPTSYLHRLTLQTQPVLRAVRRASIVARSAAHRVLLTASDGRLTITAESLTEGNAFEEVEAAIEGEDVTVAFNAKYLMDVLAVVDSEGFYLDLNEPLRPTLLQPAPVSEEDENRYLCILMPMQVV